MAGKKDNNYFEMFVKLTDFSCSAAKQFCEMLGSFDPAKMPEDMKKMHTIEHSADMEKHNMIKLLAKEFITPIEREDIFQLAQELDNVTDSIDDVTMRIYMYNIRSLRPDAIKFAELIQRCTSALREALEAFSDFRKHAAKVNECIIAVNALEEEGDRLYTEAIRGLYCSELGHLDIIAWTEVFERLEMCCDACEHVSDVIESVIMKNT